MQSEMKLFSLSVFLAGILVVCAASQDTPAPQNGSSAPVAGAKPATPPSFSSPVVAPKKTDEPAKGTDEESEGITTFRKRVDEVNVIFTVTDKHGHFVKDLKKD